MICQMVRIISQNISNVAYDGNSANAWSVTIDPSKMKVGNGVNVLYLWYLYLGNYYQLQQYFNVEEVGTAASITNLKAAYCVSESVQSITVEGIYPIGGHAEWTGTILTDKDQMTAKINPALWSGVSGNPYPITYQYTSPRGCKSAIIPKNVIINPLPVSTFTINPTYNIDGGPITINPDQPGGTFSGAGISGNKLFPDLAGLGEHTVTYQITDGNLCSSSKDNKTIIKKAEGVIEGIPSVICYKDTTYNVQVTGLPAGMTVVSFKNKKNSLVHAAGSTNASYNVKAARSGIDTLTLTYNLGGINYWITKKVEIDSIGLVSITNLLPGDKICNNEKPKELVTTINGGVFSGPVSGTYLDPTKALGNTYINYIYTSKLGCSASVTVPFEIVRAPELSFAAKDACIESGTDVTSFANNSSTFDPVVSWSWLFSEGSDVSLKHESEPSYLYKTGGLHPVTLTVKTNSCEVTKTANVDLGVKPNADFKWVNDCYAPGRTITLVDATLSDFPITSQTWNIDNGRLISTVLRPIYTMRDTGYLNVTYTVRTNFANCDGVATKAIYLSPTFQIAPNGFYKEDFENGNGSWIKEVVDNSSWQFGKPDRRVINSAASGVNAWYTKYDTIKQPVEHSSVVSPCFDFSNIKRPMISLKTIKRFNTNRNGAVLQYQIEGDNTWKAVGTFDDGIKWFNSTLIEGKPGGDKLGWTTTDSLETVWSESSHGLDALAGLNNAKFRIAYGSDGTSINNEGVSFDDIWIGREAEK